MEKVKVVFFGTPEFAVPSFKALLDAEYDVAAVITGLGKPSSPPPVKTLAQKNNLTLFQPTTLNDNDFLEQFKNLNPDLCVVVAYGKIIPEKYLSIPRFGFINIHSSLLPKYRGPSPIQSAILNGDQETGVSIMVIDKEVDHGPVLAEIKYQISKIKNYSETSKELSELGAKLLLEAIPQYIDGKIKPKEQDHNQATFTKTLNREDGKIDWSWPTDRIHDQIRALNPEPGTWTLWDNQVLNIKKTAPSSERRGPPGVVSKTDNLTAVQTGNGLLTLEIVQLEGKREVDIKDFLNGHPDFIGSTLS